MNDPHDLHLCDDCGEPRASCSCPRTVVEGQEALFEAPASDGAADRPEWA